jgi:hypothetical protein
MTPLPHATCPLCGRANDCAVARCGRFDVDCWCRDATVSRESLSRLSPADRGRACLCPRCALAPPAADPDRPRT